MRIQLFPHHFCIAPVAFPFIETTVIKSGCLERATAAISKLTLKIHSENHRFSGSQEVYYDSANP